MTNTPAVSVIIPMFNAEKYVGQCLESILAQTFTDFEVIVVDDCSTDSSAAIVESFASKFGGRLALLQLDRNTGSGAVPRNTGLKFARGEYIFFADADDLLTLTALEELCTLAKNFAAEVVYCEKYYKATPDLSKIFVDGEQSDNVTRPTFESEDLNVRVDEYFRDRFWVTPWSKLVRRDFIVDNKISFPPCKISEDDIWTCGLLFGAKKFLRVPNVVYVYRQNDESVGQKSKTLEQTLTFWVSPVICGVKALESMLSRLEFFRQNPQQLYTILEIFIVQRLYIPKTFVLPKHRVYETIKAEFGDFLGSQDVLVSALCAIVNMQQRVIDARNRRIDELERKLEEKLS